MYIARENRFRQRKERMRQARGLGEQAKSWLTVVKITVATAWIGNVLENIMVRQRSVSGFGRMGDARTGEGKEM